MKGEDESAYPHGIKPVLIMGSSYLSMFLTALIRRPIAPTDHPSHPMVDHINNKTDSSSQQPIRKLQTSFTLSDVGWYGSAYLLTNCAFQLLFGKLYKIYSVDVVFLSSIVLFEVGAAPSSTAFVLLPAVCWHLFRGYHRNRLFCPTASPSRFQGLFGAVFGLANVIALLLGGAFMDSSDT